MDLSIYPLPFHLSVLMLVVAFLYAWKYRDEGWGMPAMTVVFTTFVWYHGDALYNDYEAYRSIMGDQALTASWWQVLLFVVAFILMVRALFGLVNADCKPGKSMALFCAKHGVANIPQIQNKLNSLCSYMLTCWLAMMAIALWRTDFDFAGLFAPYLGDRAAPWSRFRLGGGVSAFLSLASYVQILLTAGFGIIAALAKNPKTRTVAIAVCCLAFPYYIFDRTRNAMIATMLPGLLSWTFLRLRGGLWKKAVILGVVFLAANSWFMYVGEYRSKGSVARIFAQKGFREKEPVEKIVYEDVEEKSGRKHEGLTMFSELAYINDFYDREIYECTWGGNYFAELVNVVPRAIWKNKPLVGIDYAIARGLVADSRYGDYAAGVTASVSTGVIGQGVVNFGRFFGPIAAALLMSLWVAILGRQDLKGQNPARLVVFSVGLILTFNMGRDITLLVLYPFVFGWLLVKLEEHFMARS